MAIQSAIQTKAESPSRERIELLTAERARLRAELRALTSSVPAALVMLDGRGRVASANARAEALLGTPLLGEPWRDIVQRAFASGTVGSDLCLRDGRLVTVATAPRGDGPGQLLWLQDVTAERQWHRQAEHSRRLADMGRMAATLAHQVRTPLSSALLYASQLADPQLAVSRRSDFTEKLISRLRDLERLVNDMLGLARGEGGAGETFAAAELFAQVHEAAREAASACDIAVRASDATDGAVVCGNPTLVKSALLNLVNNALEASAPGSELELSCHPVKPDAIEFRVRDHGRGVPESLRPRLFQPFATGRRDGAGLGLAAVRAVARAQGGDAWYAPVADGGSVFAIRLPAQYRVAERLAVNA
ncbi:MAG: PAS domain-containing sensor histidine kinase [Hydrogenophaga sp.]|nr:PAS domain-containing sensor histidine kinase [Gammaproteobacteria bacterium]